MKSIVGILKPFDYAQSLYVFENGNKIIDIATTTIEKFSERLLSLSEEYNITDVSLYGPPHFVKGIVHQIQKNELQKYNNNKLNFEIFDNHSRKVEENT